MGKIRLHTDGYKVQLLFIGIVLAILGVACSILGFKLLEVGSSWLTSVISLFLTNVGIGLSIVMGVLVWRILKADLMATCRLSYCKDRHALVIHLDYYGELILTLDTLKSIKIVNKNSYLELNVIIVADATLVEKEYIIYIAMEDYEEIKLLKETLSVGLSRNK